MCVTRNKIQALSESVKHLSNIHVWRLSHRLVNITQRVDAPETPQTRHLAGSPAPPSPPTGLTPERRWRKTSPLPPTTISPPSPPPHTDPDSPIAPCDKGHKEITCYCAVSPVPLQLIQRASLVSVTKDTLCFCPITCNLFIVTYNSQ